MNKAYRLMLNTLLAVAVTTIAVACQKKTEDRPSSSVGAASTDGYTATYSNMLGGTRTNIMLDQIRCANNNSGNGNSPIMDNNNNGNQGCGSNGQVYMTVTINGQPNQLYFVPRVGSNGAQTTNSTKAGSIMSYYLQVDTMCGDANCNTFYTDIIVQRTSTQWMQIGLLKDMNSNQVLSTYEHTTSNRLELYSPTNLYNELFRRRSNQ